jgi:hypothetical protein
MTNFNFLSYVARQAPEPDGVLFYPERLGYQPRWLNVNERKGGAKSPN